MSLVLTHPEVPACEDCQTWLYRLPSWERVTKLGEPVRRGPGEATPCGKCVKGRHDRQPHPERDLTPRNWQALQYYYQCEVDTTGILPRDAIVIRNNALIRQVIRANENASGTLALLGVMAAKRE